MSAQPPTWPTPPPPEAPPGPSAVTVSGVLWVLVGAGIGLGISVIGLVTAPLAIVGGILLGTLGRRWALTTAPLVVSGLGVVPLYVAWLNRGGPGDVCHAGGTACTEAMNPWPWAAAGVLLVALGVLLVVVAHRSETRRAARPH
ncbi:hypothetical protein [Luteimicrobium subarcticum]|uniref:Uncharacterized protein n=1 Tax=Luteimicrobium subarcticum TaxID=620910 RepID=A0A2M8W754_9MICO|nr:hypothetical protein [Luteimicrobium subarcticum]PJI86724.1 hypothetical protein CLV34_2645 [Luteimicrobium subarcticum]